MDRASVQEGISPSGEDASARIVERCGVCRAERLLRSSGPCGRRWIAAKPGKLASWPGDGRRPWLPAAGRLILMARTARLSRSMFGQPAGRRPPSGAPCLLRATDASINANWNFQQNTTPSAGPRRRAASGTGAQLGPAGGLSGPSPALYPVPSPPSGGSCQPSDAAGPSRESAAWDIIYTWRRLIAALKIHQLFRLSDDRPRPMALTCASFVWRWSGAGRGLVRRWSQVGGGGGERWYGAA